MFKGGEMKKILLITFVSILSLILIVSLLLINYLNSESYQDYIEDSTRQQLLKDIPLLDGNFTIVDSEGDGNGFFGENTYFYVIEYSNNDYDTQLSLFETSDLYQNTDGYLNEVIVRDYTIFEHNKYFSEITRCECYRILKKISHTSKYSEYIYLINGNRYAIIIDKN